MLKTNLTQVCSRVSHTYQVLQRVDQELRLEIWIRRERTKHACKNCAFFDDNDYLPCALHPDLAAQKVGEINQCRDWEVIELKD